jgi:hypothetical protein
MPFRHDAGVFRPNGVSRRNFDGLKTPNPSSFGHRVCPSKKVVGKNPNGVSAKCAIIAQGSFMLSVTTDVEFTFKEDATRKK